MKKALVTGFGPFLSVVDNPSERLIKALPIPFDTNWDIVSEILRVSYNNVSNRIPGLLSSNEFDAIVMFGVATNSALFRLETTATSVVSQTAQDAEGMTGKHSEMPESLLSNVPIEVILQECKHNQIPIELSNSAGEYLCNFSYYTVLKTIRQLDLKAKSVFIHVPPDELSLSSSGSNMSFEILSLHAYQILAIVLSNLS